MILVSNAFLLYSSPSPHAGALLTQHAHAVLMRCNWDYGVAYGDPRDGLPDVLDVVYRSRLIGRGVSRMHFCRKLGISSGIVASYKALPLMTVGSMTAFAILLLLMGPPYCRSKIWSG